MNRLLRIAAVALMALAVISPLIPLCPCPGMRVAATTSHDCCPPGLRSADQHSCCVAQLAPTTAVRTSEAFVLVAPPPALATSIAVAPSVAASASALVGGSRVTSSPPLILRI